MIKLNSNNIITKKKKAVISSLVPLGDKGVIGERDDMFNPQVTDRAEKYKHIQRYKYAAKRCRGKILDLGCGTGYGTKILYDKKNTVYGIDVSQKAINYAKKNYPGPKYVCGSAEKLPFQNDFFDAITALEIIEHVQDTEKALSEMHRVLKKEGDIFISTPNPRHFARVIKHLFFGKPYPEKVGPNIYHVKEFYYNEFLELLKKKKFKIKFAYGQTLTILSKKMVNLLIKLPFVYIIYILVGYYLPKYASTIIFRIKK